MLYNNWSITLGLISVYKRIVFFVLLLIFWSSAANPLSNLEISWFKIITFNGSSCAEDIDFNTTGFISTGARLTPSILVAFVSFCAFTFTNVGFWPIVNPSKALNTISVNLSEPKATVIIFFKSSSVFISFLYFTNFSNNRSLISSTALAVITEVLFIFQSLIYSNKWCWRIIVLEVPSPASLLVA